MKGLGSGSRDLTVLTVSRKEKRFTENLPKTAAGIRSGKAYYAFDTPEELEQVRKEYEGRGETFTYDMSTRMKMRNSLTIMASETVKLIGEGVPYVIRFKFNEGPAIVMQDLIRGEVQVEPATLDDKVLFKSDGMPTYHLANVVDDHEMKITHVIRGEEWLPSLPLHVSLYKALGWESEMPYLPTCH
jgi:glutamyl-tRNA synthetase